jgi:2-keto-4-pentenoate hydratase/2-oxohepta-3-ene-1,7-dioic acid hydratase in catechol pathway
MEILRLGPVGAERPCVRGADGVVRDLTSLTDDVTGAFLAADGLARVRDALLGLPPVDGAEALRVGAPVARPQAVLCIGQNYAAHAAETNDPPPSRPIVFFKHPNTVVGPYDDVVIPPGAEKVDWEVELSVVVGRRARYLDSPDVALQYVAGYTVGNDVSERAYQIEHSLGQWSKGKCCETFNPLGPAMVPADEVDPTDLRLWSTVNGEARQDSVTSDMVFPVADLVWSLSQYMVLEPGDVINTGTPQGVALSGRFPYLRPGDVVEMGIDGIGVQRQHVVAADVSLAR